MNNFKSFILLVLCFNLLSCSKESSDDNPDEENNNEDIYLAGMISGVYPGNGKPAVGHSIAAYWVNGEEVRLTDGAQSGHADQVLLAKNGDIFVLGGVETSYTPGISVGKRWFGVMEN